MDDSRKTPQAYTEIENLPVLGPTVIAPVNHYFNHRANAAIKRYTERYATNDDGTINQSLADGIAREIQRRNQQSMMLDVWDRALNAVVRFPIVLLSTTALLKATGLETHIGPALKKGLVSGAVVTAADLLWPLVRVEGAYYGGAQTALEMERQKNEIEARDAQNPEQLKKETFGPWTGGLTARSIPLEAALAKQGFGQWTDGFNTASNQLQIPTINR